MTRPHDTPRAQWIADEEAKAARRTASPSSSPRHGFHPIADDETDSPSRFSAFSWVVIALPLMALGLLTTCGSARAQQQSCAPREYVVKRLAEGYGESRKAMGLGGNNAVMEVFASDETGSWTITVTMPNGVTCLIASGQSFEAMAEALPPKGSMN